MKKILFICTGNTCRSPMAHALFNHYLNSKDEYLAVSAGIMAETGDRASEYAILALKNYGIDLSHHRARSLEYGLLKDAHLVLCMTKSHKEALISLFPPMADKIFTLSEYGGILDFGDIGDPYGRSLKCYEETADQIKTALVKVLERLK